MIELRDISHRDEGRAVLASVDLDLARGDVAGLTGPNGSGKSLLLRVLATLVVPRRGRFVVDGEDVIADPAPWCSTASPTTSAATQYPSVMTAAVETAPSTSCIAPSSSGAAGEGARLTTPPRRGRRAA